MPETTTELTTTYDGSTDLTENERHRLLASERRRSVLEALSDRSAPIGLGELAVDLAAREDGLDPGDRVGIRRLKTELHHVHLPMMADSGVLDYDPVTHRIDP